MIRTAREAGWRISPCDRQETPPSPAPAAIVAATRGVLRHEAFCRVERRRRRSPAEFRPRKQVKEGHGPGCRRSDDGEILRLIDGGEEEEKGPVEDERVNQPAGGGRRMMRRSKRSGQRVWM
ncbi:hypothetical protein HPP92_029103 [Vanilla planifolia]|uniref:Uncharacterized protein n=1 Tax=Vanilla planifolia TaxID=51239 RepID=A0A835U310_VANPL|nr:hypothetical protein HPP92_029103 [Vanilla planifolia]KAG0445923.1 hypothetical protein HPP92_029092 [Vanilla planifolia]